MLTLIDQNFEQEVIKSQQPILVDFWTEGCFPCSLLSPILEKLSGEFNGKFILAKVNLNEAPLIAQEYGIDRTPTVILFKEGKPVKGFIGVHPEGMIKEWLEKNL